jgi:hypothetical protein
LFAQQRHLLRQIHGGRLDRKTRLKRGKLGAPCERVLSNRVSDRGLLRKAATFEGPGRPLVSTSSRLWTLGGRGRSAVRSSGVPNALLGKRRRGDLSAIIVRIASRDGMLYTYRPQTYRLPQCPKFLPVERPV